jgi:uncharacterized protein YyaL (SSP411 family)
MLRYAGRRFVLNRVMLLVDSDESRARLGSYVPAIQGMSPVDGKAAVYVCENYMCQLPVTDVEALERLLQ